MGTKEIIHDLALVYVANELKEYIDFKKEEEGEDAYISDSEKLTVMANCYKTAIDTLKSKF